MKALEVTAQVPEKRDSEGNITKVGLGPATITVSCPETAEEAIQMFGDEAVYSNAIAQWVITLQGNIRSGLKKGEDEASIAARLADAKMGVSAQAPKVDPEQAYLALYARSTPEEQARMIQELQAKVAALTA